MRRSRGFGGAQFTAHLVFAPLVGWAAWTAWRISYPDVCALMGVYLVAAVTLHEMLDRMGARRGTRLFARTGKAWAVLAGLSAAYVTSDAWVLEQASRAYPASGRWFGLLLGAVVVLGAILLVRRSGGQRSAVPPAIPGFTAMGLAVFVTLLLLQLLTMAALLPWGVLAVSWRIVFCAAAAWIAGHGAAIRHRAVMAWGLAFLWLGLMTAYLDLLWTWRHGLPFLAGAAALGVALAAGMAMLGRKSAARA